MKISFSSESFSLLDFQALAGLARRCGCDGVEMPAGRNASHSQSNLLLTATEKIQQIFSNANIEICAITIGRDLSELPERISLAARFNCRFLKLSADALFGRTDTVAPAVIDRLFSTGDIAAAVDVTLLIGNQPVRGSAVRLWHLLDRLNHPAIACSWNTSAAACANDSPAVAVPMLNSRIRYVDLQDPDNGSLSVRKTVDRLRGIGYDGYLRIGFSDSAQPEQSLMAAQNLLRHWQVLPIPAAR
jgi:sugar phosphate isomerase/epimerase